MSGFRAPLPVRAYDLLRRVHRRLGAPAPAAFTGFWLGALSHASLHALDELMYRGPGSYRDDAHNLGGLFAWEKEALAGWFRGRERLLLVGAGGGRETVALARMGFGVDSYECNPALVEYAAGLLARAGVAAEIRPIPRDRAPAEGGPYDGAVVGWSAYMLIAGRERRVHFLRGLRERMMDGAPLLLSFWTREESAPGPHRVARIANRVRRVLGRPPVDVGDDLVPNYLHHFTAAEVADEMRAGGFGMQRFVPYGPGGRDSGWAVGRAE
ncbi:MAG: hypothetical protein JWM27_331 [Gemmatimonadetes bacterium]|nr:hypothetical protein [Gemmatimonadota bacterium]